MCIWTVNAVLDADASGVDIVDACTRLEIAVMKFPLNVTDNRMQKQTTKQLNQQKSLLQYGKKVKVKVKLGYIIVRSKA